MALTLPLCVLASLPPTHGARRRIAAVKACDKRSTSTDPSTTHVIMGVAWQLKVLQSQSVNARFVQPAGGGVYFRDQESILKV